MERASAYRPQVGRPIRRVEDQLLLAGHGRYVDDVQFPDALTLAVVRSPYPHARLHAVRVEHARTAPGVVDVLVGADTAHLTHSFVLPTVPDIRRPGRLPLQTDTVRFVGDEVAAVLARTPAQARDAADRIEVDYLPLPGVADPSAALAADATVLHTQFGSNVAFTATSGSALAEVDAALAAAEHRVSLELRSPRVAAMALEPRTFVARFVADRGVLQVWASTQMPAGLHRQLAAALDIDPSRIELIAPHVGGGFGARNTLHREEVLAAFLARKHGLPVRWTATRSEDLITTQQGRDQIHHVEAGFAADGRLLALKVRIVAAVGAYLVQAAAVPGWRAARLICGPYRVPVAASEVTGVFTNTPPTGPYRGAGRPEATLSLERTLDVAARELGIDRFEIRRRNLVRAADMPWTTPTGLVYDTGNYVRALDIAQAELQAPAENGARLFGVGVCAFLDPSAGPAGESARVVVDPAGTVTAYSGSFSHGQGHATSFAQVVADRFEIPLERIRIVQGDPLALAGGIGTYAARSMALGGSAVYRASEQVLRQLADVAARMLEVPAADVRYASGQFQPVGVPQRVVALGAVAAGADPDEREAELRFEEPADTYAYGCHVAAVAVDPETGQIELTRYVAVDDAGVLVNPLLAAGQVHGGVVQGIGQAVFEHMRFDADGTVLTASLGDYAIPRAVDLPTIDLVSLSTPTPLNPLGVKGIGESGAVAAPAAVLGAVLDALAPRGVTHLDLPLTPERVWGAIQSSAQRP